MMFKTSHTLVRMAAAGLLAVAGCGGEPSSADPAGPDEAPPRATGDAALLGVDRSDAAGRPGATGRVTRAQHAVTRAQHDFTSPRVTATCGHS